MQIDVDTNRDGVVQDEPQSHKQEFTNQYRAIVLVNTDDNIDPPAPPDAMPRDADDQVVPNADDAAQLSQIVIQKLGVDPLPANWVITLSLVAPQNEPAALAMPAAQNRIRVFYRDDSQNFPDNYVPILGPGVSGTYTFPNPPSPPEPDLSGKGTVTLYMEGCEYGADVFLVLTVTAGGKVLGKDQARVMPTPLVFLSNVRTVQHGWVFDDGSAPGSETGAVRDRMLALLGGQVTTYTIAQVHDSQGRADQWAQDEWELGMTSRPPGTGADDVWTNGVDLPRGGALDAYEQAYMRGPVPDVNAVYGGWAYLAGATGPGSFGGNLEVSPPTANFALGLLTIGNTMVDANLLAFLKRQRLQVQNNNMGDWTFGRLDTSWLAVGHVDEIMCYVPGDDGTQGFKIVVADPGRARSLLNPNPPPADTDIESYATFFYDGTHEEAGSVTAVGANNQIIDNTKNFPALVGPPTNYKFVRIYAGVGQGQVAQIDVNETQKLGTAGVTDTLVVANVWTVPDSETVRQATLGGGAIPAPLLNWNPAPEVGSLYVLVEDTKPWFDGNGNAFPAIITSLEVRNDKTLWDHNVAWNATSAQGRIYDTIRGLCGLLGIEFLNDVIFIPEMYLVEGNANQALVNASGAAFNPGMVNLQPVNGNLTAAKPFGPRWQPGIDLFQSDAESQLDGNGRSSTDADFVDDWDWYHLGTGEVHCGTNVRREPTALEIGWWLQWNSDNTMPPP